MAEVDGDALEHRLDAMFAPSCDPYRAGAAILFDKPSDMISQNDRDIVKRVFMRMASRRGYLAGEPTLRSAADLFHEIVSSYSAEKLLAKSSGPALLVIRDKLRESLRSRDQIQTLASDGFELCVRALAEMGVSDVTIHECGSQALGEAPWSGGDE